PEDWGNFVVQASTKNHVVKDEENFAALPERMPEKFMDTPASAAEPELPPPAIGTDTLRVMPSPASTTDASLQLARQVARLIADAKQQISAAAREAAAQAVAVEHREAEEIARRIVAQSQEIERRIGEHASVTSAVLESQARRQEEAFGEHHERLSATAGAAQQQLTDAATSAQGDLQARLAEQVESA